MASSVFYFIFGVVCLRTPVSVAGGRWMGCNADGVHGICRWVVEVAERVNVGVHPECPGSLLWKGRRVTILTEGTGFDSGAAALLQ